jgi:N,N'-diacetyllegionaminate synthase
MFDLLAHLRKAVFIIGEIGNNHNGKKETAKQLIDIAAAAGVDAVKFQTFRGQDIVTPQVKASEYPGWDTGQFEYWYQFLDTIALPLEDHREVFAYATAKGVLPFSTPTSVGIVDFLEELGTPLYKIASMDVTNIQLLSKVAATGKPVILSTGMSTEDEIAKAVAIFEKNQFVLLHCISDYPADPKQSNLLSIPYLKEKFGVPVGYSDHTLTNETAGLAVALGARVIEKHYTYNRHTPEKAEHHFSLEPDELIDLVETVQLAEAAMGSYQLYRSPSELENRGKYRRSLHVNKDLPAGSKLTAADIVVLRPNNGAQPEEYDLFEGRELKTAKKAWEPLVLTDITA